MRYGWTIGAALLALAGCGRSMGPQVTGPGNVTMGGTPGDITISTPNGTAEIHTGGAAAMPEGIPAYPNAVPGQAVDIHGGSAQGQGQIVGFSTNDAPAQVIAFYAQAVAAAGYSVANRMDMGATSILTARKAEGQTVSITATQAGGSTQVHIVVAAR